MQKQRSVLGVALFVLVSSFVIRVVLEKKRGGRETCFDMRIQQVFVGVAARGRAAGVRPHAFACQRSIAKTYVQTRPSNCCNRQGGDHLQRMGA